MSRAHLCSVSLAVFSFASPLLAQTTTLAVKSPTKSGDDTINITYKDAQGVSHALPAPTGQPGNSSDDLTKGMSEVDKATRYAEAINDAAAAAAEANGTPGQPPVAASSLGSHVTVTGANGFTLDHVNVSSNTSQKVKGLATLTVGSFASLPGEPLLLGTVEFTDGIAGRTMDGEPSFVSVGTDRYVATLPTAPFTRLEDLTLALVDSLQANGVRATASADGLTILILLDADIDVWIEADTDDRVTNFELDVGKL